MLKTLESVIEFHAEEAYTNDHQTLLLFVVRAATAADRAWKKEFIMQAENKEPELYAGFFVLPVRYTVPAVMERELGPKVHLLARRAFDEIVRIGNWFNVYYHRFEADLEDPEPATFELSCWFNETDRVVEIDIREGGEPIVVDLPEGLIDELEEASSH
jgi:hypothetical protein